MKPIVTALLFFLAHAAHAAEGVPSMTSSVLQMLVGLAIVMGALFGLLTMLRKLQSGRTHLVGGFKVMAATSVGPRERVVLVSLGSKVLVLGVCPGSIKALHTLDASELPQEPEPTPSSPPDFAARLRQMLENRHAR